VAGAGAAAPAGVRRTVALAGAVIFLDTLFYTAITPLLPGYVHDLGLSHATAGLLTASYPVGTLLAAVPAAWLGARVGVKAAMVGGLTMFAASSLTFGLADSIGVLMGARFAQGAAGALSWGAALGWVSGAAPSGRRGALLGLALGAATAGTIVGPVLGSIAAATGTVVAGAAVAAVAIALAGAVLRQQAPPGQRVGSDVLARVAGSARAWAASWLYALFGLFGGAMALLGPLELSAAGAGASAIGLVFLLAALGELAVSPLAGRVADRRGALFPVRLVLPAAALSAVGLAFAHAAVPVGVLLVLALPAAGVLMAPASTLLAEAADARALPQLAVSGLGNMAWSVGEMSGAAGAGALGTTPACLLLAGVTLATWASTVAGGRSRR
jgi:DHA1 family solute carrier family 18 vesicular amine transporter 1/2